MATGVCCGSESLEQFFPGGTAIATITGNVGGLKTAQLKGLERIAGRRVSPDLVVSPELAKELCAVAFELGRQIGVLISRAGQVEASAAAQGGQVAEFTGDGCLLLFSGAESGVLCLSRIIRDWEIQREKYTEKYTAAGLPDGKFLALRTGVSFGDFVSFDINGETRYAGSGINKARRCEAASKEYFYRRGLGS